jgi:hypothetical protein
MNGMRFLSALTAGSQQLARRFFLGAALACACGLSGAVGLGFATHALYRALALQYGVVNASIAVAAIYLILAGILYLCYRRVAAPAAKAPSRLTRALPDDAEALRAATQASDAPQAAAVAMGLELAKQMTPLQLTMVAVISGFVAGRRL